MSLIHLLLRPDVWGRSWRSWQSSFSYSSDAVIVGVAVLASDTTVQVTIITTLGLIIVAVIGVWQVKVTTNAKKEAGTAKDEAKNNAAEALVAAQMAKDYAAAMGIKDATIAALEKRVEICESENARLSARLDDFERRDEEHREAQRAAALIERSNASEIEGLRRELAQLRSG